MNKAMSRVVRPIVLLGASAAINLHSQTNSPEVVLQFEPPTIVNDGRVITFWTEQGFNVSAPTNRMVHQDSGPAQWPDNGGAYLITFPIQNTSNIIISNASGGLFDVKAVDLAEWVPDVGTNLTVTFRGVSANGLVVAGRTFELDRIYDGSGPLADFQTFTFTPFLPPFVQLRELWVSTSTRFAMDNLRLAPATFTNALPTVRVVTPTNGQTFVEGDNVVVSAAAEDPDGAIARVALLVDGRSYAITNPPYSIVLSNVLRGTHNVRATTIDDRGAQASSAAVLFNVVPGDAPPVVSFTSPPHGTAVAPSEAVLLEAAASQPAGSIVSVAFYEEDVLLGTDDTAHYSLVWSNATRGSYFITAIATDHRGSIASASILILVGEEGPVLTFDPPTLPGGSQAISNWTEQGYDVRGPINRMSHVDSGAATNLPSNGSAYLRFVGGVGGIPVVSNTAGATFSALSIDLAETGTTNLMFRGLTANSNIVVQRFLLDGIGDGPGPAQDFQTLRFDASFTHLVRLDVFSGTLAMDNLRLFTEPSNAAPMVILTSPTNSARFNDLADIPITGVASDADGGVMRVEVFANDTLVGTSGVGLDGEFGITWSNAWAGSHILTARAYDFSGATTVSAPVSILVSTNPFAPITIQFAPATLPRGSAGIPSWSERGFLFETQVRMTHTDSGVSDGFPANGGAYLQFSVGAAPLTITYPSGEAFRLHSVDLAEYSTLFVRPQIQFLGTRLDDSTVSQTFVLDGSIDGTGPLADFQTFVFSPGFANLKMVQVLVDGYSLDNLRVEVSLPNQPPTVTLLAPVGSVTNVQGDVVEVRSEATDPDGEIVRVDYFFGAHFAASAFSPPYAASFIIDAPGIYGIRAVAIDDDGASSSSESATLRVLPKPEVRITSPLDGTTYLVGRPIAIQAQAASIGANITALDLLAGDTEIAETAGPSLQFTWTDVPPGDYSLSARATDDRHVTGVSAPVLVKVRANSPPSFVIPPSVQVPEDSGSQILINWASAIMAGPAYEAGQTVFFEVSNSNPALFAVQPAIAPDGILSFTPAPDAFGSASVSVVLHDDGGTEFQGQDTSAPQTFVLTVTPLNDSPVANAVVRSPTAIATNDGVLLILAAAGNTTGVILDGSLSTDPENDPLDYLWIEEASAIAEGRVVTNVFGPGLHEVTLAVSDGAASSMSVVHFVVITPETAVEFIIAVVDDAELATRNKRPLISTLKAASASFAQGKINSALGQLCAFQNKVRAQVAPSNPELAAELEAEIQKLLDLVTADE